MGRRLLVVGMALILAVAPRAAWAHAVLFSADPFPDTVVATAPASVTLTFSEPVIPAGKTVQVFAPSGEQVAGPVRVDGRMMTAAIRGSETGTYVVLWQALSSDTHPSRGAFRFVVGQASPNPYLGAVSSAEIGTATPGGFVLQALARWFHFLGFALAFGTTVYQLATRPDPRLRRLLVGGVILLVVAEPVALVAQLASLSLDGDTATAMLASPFGRLLGLRLGAALLTWALLALESPWPVLALGGVMALLDGASAHAIAGLPGVSVGLDAVHVAAMGLWVGGLAAFIIAPDRRFRPYAIGGLAFAVGTGVILAVAHLGSPAALVTTGYGTIVVLKTAVVAIVIGIAWLRRHRIEAGAAALILAVAAVLISLPPPR